MGFEARSVIHELLDEAIKKKAEVRVIAYDLNLPEILTRLEKLKSRLKVIIDDSDATHKAPTSPESKSAARLRKTAGTSNVKRQHMAESAAPQVDRRSRQGHQQGGLRLDELHLARLLRAVEQCRRRQQQEGRGRLFRRLRQTTSTRDSAPRTSRLEGVRQAGTSSGSPDSTRRSAIHRTAQKNGLLADVGKDIGKAKSCVLFSLAFLGQMTKGPIGPALGKQIKSKTVYTLGIADANVKAGNLGVTVLTPDNKRRIVRSSALTGNVPAPFSTEPSGLSGENGNHRGTRMHHKFVVLDFDTADARVYFGSYNFSEPADQDNGENLVLIKDRTVATSYMIEARAALRSLPLPHGAGECQGQGTEGARAQAAAEKAVGEALVAEGLGRSDPQAGSRAVRLTGRSAHAVKAEGAAG